MAIKRYFASQDNTITNAFKANLRTRGTGSNMGASDILEAFVIHGQTSASIDAANAEQARILIQFPIDAIVSQSRSRVPRTATNNSDLQRVVVWQTVPVRSIKHFQSVLNA